jgi:hypothetical protein
MVCLVTVLKILLCIQKKKKLFSKPLTNNSKYKTLLKCGAYQKTILTFITYQSTFSIQNQKTVFKTIKNTLNFSMGNRREGANM